MCKSLRSESEDIDLDKVDIKELCEVKPAHPYLDAMMENLLEGYRESVGGG